MTELTETTFIVGCICTIIQVNRFRESESLVHPLLLHEIDHSIVDALQMIGQHNIILYIVAK